jgi:type I site-specific restriction endonuclease
MPITPEDKAREVIDKMLEKAGWHICDMNKPLKRAERLRQSILKKAFSGRLVSQEANYKLAGD